jgi:hypothetical protein
LVEEILRIVDLRDELYMSRLNSDFDFSFLVVPFNNVPQILNLNLLTQHALIVRKDLRVNPNLLCS